MKEIIKQFIKQIDEDQKLSSNTKIAYKIDLHDFLEYVLFTNSSVQNVNQAWVKDYLSHLEKQSNERNSYNRRASTFRTFLKFLYKNKLVPTNYSLIVSNKTVFFKTDEGDIEIDLIDKIINESDLKPEQKIILLLISKVGLTATQVSSLKTYQIDFEQRTINTTDTDSISLPHDVFKLLREYILEIRANYLNANQSLTIFIDERGEEINDLEIYRLVKKLSEDPNLKEKSKLTTRRLKKMSSGKIDYFSMQREIFNAIGINQNKEIIKDETPLTDTVPS